MILKWRRDSRRRGGGAALVKRQAVNSGGLTSLALQRGEGDATEFAPRVSSVSERENHPAQLSPSDAYFIHEDGS